MKTIINSIMFCMAAIALTSCWHDDPIEADPGTIVDPQPSTGEVLKLSSDGLVHSFIYSGYEPLQSKPITVFYNIPTAGDPTTMPILFILPGEDRDAETHLKLFQSWAKTHNVMLFSLQYGTDYYPTTTEYILGGMNTKQSATGLLPSNQWNFNYIEKLFDEIVLATGSKQPTYDLWGHSAGAQYVHRYVTFMPDARIGRAVACNSGWYSVPDLTVDFPYGMKSVSEATTDTQKKALARNLYVFVGSADTSTAGLNTNEGSQKQGENRKERAHYYFDEAQSIAKSKGYNFGWQFAEVPNVAHDAAGMAQGSWSVLER